MRIRDITSKNPKTRMLKHSILCSMKSFYTHVVLTRTSEVEGWGYRSTDWVAWIGFCESVRNAIQRSLYAGLSVDHMISIQRIVSFVDLTDLNPSLFISQQLTSTNADYRGRYDHPARGIVGHKVHPLP
jgi:hypothetical protein